LRLRECGMFTVSRLSPDRDWLLSDQRPGGMMKARVAKRKRLQNGGKKTKKIYETPKLKKFGSITELTQGNAAGGADLLLVSVTG
jgi:hypothetical protein